MLPSNNLSSGRLILRHSITSQAAVNFEILYCVNFLEKPLSGIIMKKKVSKFWFLPAPTGISFLKFKKA